MARLDLMVPWGHFSLYHVTGSRVDAPVPADLGRCRAKQGAGVTRAEVEGHRERRSLKIRYLTVRIRVRNSAGTIKGFVRILDQ